VNTRLPCPVPVVMTCSLLAAVRSHAVIPAEGIFWPSPALASVLTRSMICMLTPSCRA